MSLVEGSESLSKSLMCSLVSGVEDARCQERVSDSTKEQKGRGRTRNNGQVVRKCKALVKAVVKEQGLGMCVFTREGTHK